jgi:hypothetical protein
MMTKREKRLVARAWWRLHRGRKWLAALIWLDRRGIL